MRQTDIRASTKDLNIQSEKISLKNKNLSDIFFSIYPAAIPGTYLVVRDIDIKVKIYSIAELRFIYELLSIGGVHGKIILNCYLYKDNSELLLTSLETHSKRNISTTISWNSITMEVLNRIA